MVRARKGEPGQTLPHQLPTAPPMRPRDVVQELRLHVSGKELAVRLGERIRWHRQRGDDLIERMKKLAEVEREATEELARALGGVRLAANADREAAPRAPGARGVPRIFLRDYLSADDIYRLDSSDLKMTEILPDTVW